MGRMREFWDERAEENALFFVDNTLDYRNPDEARFWAQGREWLDQLLGEVDVRLRADDDVVEIGCGVGRLTHEIARRARSVRALDISPRMLELARRNGEGVDNVEWMLGDGESLAGIDDASADACISHVVFQHIPDPAVTMRYVREMGRVLRPGGWAAFQVSNDRQIHRRRRGREAMHIFLRAITRRGPTGQADPHWLGSAVDLDDLARAAAEGGLEVRRISGAGTQFCFVLLERAKEEAAEL